MWSRCVQERQQAGSQKRSAWSVAQPTLQVPCATAGAAAHLGGNGPAHNTEHHEVGDALGSAQRAACRQGKQSREHTSASTRSRGQQQGEPMESHGRCHTLCRLSAPGPGGRPAPVVFSVHLQARGQAASRAAVGSGRHNTTGGRAEHKAERPAGIAAEHTKPLWCLPLCVMRQLSRNSSTSRAAPARPTLTRSTGPAGWPQGPAQWRPCRRCPHPHPPLPAQPGGLSVAAARRAGLPTGEASRKI